MHRNPGCFDRLATLCLDNYEYFGTLLVDTGGGVMAREPKYRLVEKTVHEMIENGTLKVGDQVPTEEELLSLIHI